MQTFTVVFEFALIIALGGVWWLARRDLLMLVTRQQTPTLREMERVQASIEELLERLEAKTAAERRYEERASEAPPRLGHAPETDPTPGHGPPPAPPWDRLLPTGTPAVASGAGRYAEVTRLADAGLDPEEIAHRTGLGLTEVRLVISARP